MQVKITFRSMPSDPVIEAYANKHLAHIIEFLAHERSPVIIELVLSPHHIHGHHHIELFVRSPDYDLIADREGPEFYKVLDTVIDIMTRNLHEEKRKHVDDRKRKPHHNSED